MPIPTNSAFFHNRIFPIYTYGVATEALNASQWEAVGWQNRRGLSDYRVLFNYMIPNADGRIIADLMAGEPNEFTSHFIANKKIPYAGPRVLRSFFGTLKKAYMVNELKKIPGISNSTIHAKRGNDW